LHGQITYPGPRIERITECKAVTRRDLINPDKAGNPFGRKGDTMNRHPVLPLLVLFLFAAQPVFGFGVVNPHESMEETACLSCHYSVPVAEDSACGEYRLLKDSIEATCRSCHPGELCALGVGRVVHLSGIETWKSRGPRTLPLYEGKITCTTCHYRLKPAGEDFKMVRNVVFRDGNPDLRPLCADCHEGYEP
jgi:hypothetical protein